MEFKMSPDGTMQPTASNAGPDTTPGATNGAQPAAAPLTGGMTPPAPAMGDGGTAPGMVSGDLIKDGDMNTFMADVIEASKSQPVIVDFWAPWCGPCKQLGPALEKLVRGYGGLVRMVKVNVDENQPLAQQLQIQSIPTVYAFKDGRPVDAFAGALPESQLKSFIDKLIGDAKAPIDAALEEAEALLAAGDATGASARFAEVLGADEENAAAIGGLIRCHVVAGEADHARAFFESLTPAMQAKAEITQAMSALDLAEATEDAGDVAELRARVDANEKDHQARFDLAMALVAHNKNEDAVDALIEIIRRDRAWNDEAARKQLLKIFDTLGNADPVTQDGRRKLSSVLFS